MTTPTQTEYGPEIVVDGVRLPWLKDDEMVPVRRYRTGAIEVGEHVIASGVSWYICEWIRLPASHPYYTILNHNAKHGSQFKYWPGGDEAPGDYAGGPVLFRNGSDTEDSDRKWRWTHHTDYDAVDIIGYTPKPCAPVVDQPKDGANLKFNDCPLGLYRVYWESGGSSLAAIGFDSKGDRWIAPTNWLSTARMRDLGEFGEIAQLQPLTSFEDEYAQDVDNQQQPDFVPCERTVRYVAAMVEDWSNNALSSETSRMTAAVAKDILLNALPKPDRAEELVEAFYTTLIEGEYVGDYKSLSLRFARWAIAQGEIRG